MIENTKKTTKVFAKTGRKFYYLVSVCNVPIGVATTFETARMFAIQKATELSARRLTDNLWEYTNSSGTFYICIQAVTRIRNSYDKD